MLECIYNQERKGTLALDEKLVAVGDRKSVV